MDNAETALDLSFGREPFATFAADFVEKNCCSLQSLLPDGFARHITESELRLNSIAIPASINLISPLGVYSADVVLA